MEGTLHAHPTRALDFLISEAHAAGVNVHFWAWGDGDRQWLPKPVSDDFLEGGNNGPGDRRLQRYIADRLGPLPGWPIGYGFDLSE